MNQPMNPDGTIIKFYSILEIITSNERKVKKQKESPKKEENDHVRSSRTKREYKKKAKK